MLRALLEAGIVPDLVVGTSVGAINGVVVAEDPTTGAVQRLADLWLDLDSTDLFGGSVFGRLSTLARTRTSLHTDQPLRDALTSHLPPVRSRSCTSRSSAWRRTWSGRPSTGSPAARWSRPCSRPARCPGCSRRSSSTGRLHGRRAGAQHPGRPRGGARRDHALRAAGRPDRAAARAAAAAVGGRAGRVRGGPAAPVRRGHGLAAAGVAVHVLPTGAPERAPDLRSQLRYRDRSGIARRIDSAYAATPCLPCALICSYCG